MSVSYFHFPKLCLSAGGKKRGKTAIQRKKRNISSHYNYSLNTKAGNTVTVIVWFFNACFLDYFCSIINQYTMLNNNLHLTILLTKFWDNSREH